MALQPKKPASIGTPSLDQFIKGGTADSMERATSTPISNDSPINESVEPIRTVNPSKKAALEVDVKSSGSSGSKKSKKSQNVGKVKFLSLIDEEDYERLRIISFNTKKSSASIVRFALKKHLDELEKTALN